ncbi:MAG TPA: CsbD family protein [Vicinamibacterales bacterium]
MTKDQSQGKWRQMRGEVKAQWGRLTDEDLEQVNGNLERLLSVIQERYGYARQGAQQDVDAFRKERARAGAGPER